MSIDGRWRIGETELWDEDAIDLLGPAFVEIGPRDDGSELSKLLTAAAGSWTTLLSWRMT